MKPRQRTRPPTRPGEILREEFLTPLGLTQRRLAEHIRCDVSVINRIVNGARVTVPMALRLAAAFGTTPEFWLSLQLEVDLYEQKQRETRLPALLPETRASV